MPFGVRSYSPSRKTGYGDALAQFSSAKLLGRKSKDELAREAEEKKKKDDEEAAKALGEGDPLNNIKPPDKKRVKAKCGKIQFDFEVEVPPEVKELCEECCKGISAIYCLDCDQLMCARCQVLCHPRDKMGAEPHPHEKPDRFGKTRIRPLDETDIGRSRVVVDRTFYLPTHEYLESSYLSDRPNGWDITVPNGLAFNKSYTASKAPLSASMLEGDGPSMLKYSQGDRLIFYDPASGKEAFGRVVSEWDLRHGAVAPTMIRGDQCCPYYVVEMIDFVANIGGPDKVTTIVEPPPPPVEFPVFYNAEYIPFRDNKLKALQLDKKVAAAKLVQQVGPRRHFKDEEKRVRAEEGSPKSRFQLNMAAEHTGLTPPPSREASPSRLQQLLFEVNSSMLMPSATGDEPGGADDDDDVSSIGGSEGGEPGLRSAGNRGLLPSPRESRDRLLLSSISEMDSGVDMGNVNLQRATRLLVLPETLLCRPQERSRLLANARFGAVKKVIDRTFVNLFKQMQRTGFDVWVSNMAFIRERQLFACARRIQAMARMVAARRQLEGLRQRLVDKRRQQWEAVHAQFNYTQPHVSRQAVTMDNKLFFETTTDANRFASFLRAMGTKIFLRMNVKRQDVLRMSLLHWRKSADEFNISDIKFGHFSEHAVDVEDEQQLLTLPQQQLQAKHMHERVLANGNSLKGLSLGEDFDHVTSLPLLLKRYNDSGASELERSLPPYHPSIGLTLPSLPELYQPKTLQERLEMKDERRLEYGGFRGKHAGPSDHSCWVIPGLLCMGRLPHGLAQAGGKTSAVLNLLLNGINTFVSLMEEQEERQFLAEHDIGPIQESFKPAIASARMTIASIVKDAEVVINENKNELDLLPVYDKKDHRYEKAFRQRMRCLARIKLATEGARKARQQLNAIPRDATANRWERVAIKRHDVPSVEEMLRIVWDLERKLSEGARVYIYSQEGHGRAGMLAGLLLGRLYGFSYQDTLYRLQAAHDCMVSEYGGNTKKIHISCPQLPCQREVIKQILDKTNRIFMGVNWRWASDPETHVSELHSIARGLPQGVQARILEGKPAHSDKRGVYFANEAVQPAAPKAARSERDPGDPVLRVLRQAPDVHMPLLRSRLYERLTRGKRK